MKVLAPNGKAIVGILEKVYGVAGIHSDSFKTGEDGKLDFDYTGNTDIVWDSQVSEKRSGIRVFVDEAYNEWTEDQLVVKPVDLK